MSENKVNFEFMGKYIITADIKLETALHIGGTEEGFDIGGLDNPVIKDKVTGVPYIPGSSLKGKMRSLLEWGYNEVKIEKNKKNNKLEGKSCSDPTHPIGIVFGVPAEAQNKEGISGPTRLTVRDAYPWESYPDPDKIGDIEQIKKWESAMGEKIYTEVKTENTIDRLTSEANPRSMERVPAGSVFKAEFIYDVYSDEDIKHLKLLFEGMLLLEHSYLGGSGTRGSGKIKFENIKIIDKDKSEYIGGERKLKKSKQNGYNTPKDILDNFDKIFTGA